MIDFFFYTTIVLFIIVCLFMILLILIQKGRGGGLASAFGGAGGNTAFGSKTGDVLTWATSIVFGVFLLLAVALNLLADTRQNRATAQANAPQSESAPVQLPGAGSPGPMAIPTTPDPVLGAGVGRGTQPPAPIGSAPSTAPAAPAPGGSTGVGPATGPAPAPAAGPGPAAAPSTPVEK